MYRPLIIWLFLFFYSVSSSAQVLNRLSNWHTKKIAIRSDTLHLDSLSIVPGSIQLAADTSAYVVDWAGSLFWWKQRPAGDSVVVRYRTFPYAMQHPVLRYRYDSISNHFLMAPVVRNGGKKEDDISLFNFGNIQYSGSFGRSLSFGNSQDAVVNSSLNLQLNGIIGDSIELAAAITDNNIPLQPDGTTQQLSEFDKVYIQFKKRDWQVSLGDIDLRRSSSPFFSFYKRMQGITVGGETKTGKEGSNKVIFSGAIAKGKFTRNVFTGLEGNQGPYRLQGSNGELYFTVLAGTEKVFIDGVGVQRGEDQDYVINYNTAEITFTSKRMITKDQRIQVEFEYADRNYLNTQFLLGDDWMVNKQLKVHLDMYSNIDAKNSPINQVLTSDQENFLSQLSDTTQNALYPVFAKDTFSTSAIQYALRDSTVNGVFYDSVFVYSTNPDSAVFNLSFLDVGVGYGDYVLDESGVNGRVYRWVAPVDGVRSGEYSPGVLLVAPKRHQLVSSGMEYRLDAHTTLNTELAMSNYTANAFSVRHVGSQTGLAGKVGLSREQVLNKDRGLKLLASGSFERVQAAFQPIERLRSVEFYRDWGLPVVQQKGDEQLMGAGVGVQDKNRLVRYDFNAFQLGNAFTASRHALQQAWQGFGWQWRASANLTLSDSLTNKGVYFKPNLELNKTLGGLGNMVVGATYGLESNVIKIGGGDSLNARSYAYDSWQVYVRSPQKGPNWGITYTLRRDRVPMGSQLLQADASKNTNVYYEWQSNTHHQFRVNATWRQLDVKDAKLTTLVPENSLLGRAEYAVNLGKGALTGTLLYELGAGQEQKRSYSFIEVAAGQGQYTWIDYNNDEIKTVNEFELAQFQDQATYVKVYTSTNEYIKANYTQFNYSVSMNPSVAWSGTTNGFKKVLNRFSTVSSMQVNKKEMSDRAVMWNPFNVADNDTALISLTSVVSNSLFFNRVNAKWGLDLTHSVNNTKSYLTYGAESHRVRDLSMRGRWNLSRSFTLESTGKWDKNTLLTPAFDNRNYDIGLYMAQQQVSYMNHTKYRLSLSYRWQQQKNAVLYGGERALSNAFTVETKYNVVTSSSLAGRLEMNTLKYSGTDLTTTTAYTMLEGLEPGKNYLWTIDFTKRLLGNIELTLQYEGRKPGDGKTVNTGRASVRALF